MWIVEKLKWFCQEQTDLENPLLVFQKLSRFEIFKYIFEVYFSGYLQNQFPILDTNFGHILQEFGNKFLKNGKGFGQERTHSQKLLSGFTHVSQFETSQDIFETYFS